MQGDATCVGPVDMTYTFHTRKAGREEKGLLGVEREIATMYVPHVRELWRVRLGALTG